MEQQSPFPIGPQASPETFTNKVWFNLLVPDEDHSFDTHVYNVNFEPAARTYWHWHPGGQILLVTSGIGFYQEKGKPARKLLPGDVVTIPAAGGSLAWRRPGQQLRPYRHRHARAPGAHSVAGTGHRRRIRGSHRPIGHRFTDSG